MESAKIKTIAKKLYFFLAKKSQIKKKIVGAVLMNLLEADDYIPYEPLIAESKKHGNDKIVISSFSAFSLYVDNKAKKQSATIVT